MNHAIESLWSRHAPELGYPAGVVPVPKPIPGIAFFPGGYGLWRPDVAAPLPPLPVGGVMVLGHDFHSEVGYRESLKRGRESPSQPTWWVLLALLDRVGIHPAGCFFTNVYMGLRAGRKTTGPFPGAKDSAYVDHCLRFLREQLAAQRPSLVITLGVNVPPLLARLSGDLDDWGGRTGFEHLDDSGPQRTGVRFLDLPSFSTSVVALLHPSMRHSNIRKRRYRGHVGDEAEVAMLKDALASRVQS